MAVPCETSKGTLIGAVLGTFFGYTIVIAIGLYFMRRIHKKRRLPPVPPKDQFYPYQHLTYRPQLMAQIRCVYLLVHFNLTLTQATNPTEAEQD